MIEKIQKYKVNTVIRLLLQGSLAAAVLFGCTSHAFVSLSIDTDTDSDDGDATDTGPDTGMTGHQVFEQEALLEYHITMDDADLEQIEEHGDEEVYLPAELSVRGGSIDAHFDTVGFRHKGSWSLHHCYEDGYRTYEEECAKISYKVKFSEYDAAARLYGLKRLNLHAMSGDDSKLKERLAYDLFNSFETAAPRTAYALLFINEEPLGLFVQVEEIDGRFTASRFPEDGDGNLYKEVWPVAGLPVDHYLYHLETNDDPEDHPDASDIQTFGDAVGECTEENFESVIEEWVDLDALLRYVAVDRASKNWDGIMTFYSPDSPHNFYWYHEALPGGLFHLIPWDMDNTFWEFDPVVHPEQWVTAEPVPNWNMLPYSCDPMPIWEPNNETRVTPPGCDPLIRLLAKTQWNRFVEIGKALLDGPFQLQVMEPKLAQWESEIDDALKDDPFIDYDDWKDAAADLRAALKRGVTDFSDHLEEGYSTEEPPVIVPEPSDEALNAEAEEHGLLVDVINNFEFTSGAASSAPKDVSVSANTGTKTAATWNTDAPLSGNADFRLDFEIPRVAGAWNEWIDASLYTDDKQEFDITNLSEISVTMSADRPRTVRVSLRSPVYDSEFNGAWADFMMEFSVDTEPQNYKVKLDRLFYPSWAKDAWSVDQGWTTSDGDALQKVLARFQGLIFSPLAVTDGGGELIDDVEIGFIQVDNIYFR